MWGWIADYPDPENFLFLLYGPNSTSVSGGVNTANFQNAEYDRLFLAMKDAPNGPERRQLIERMREIGERERPWIELNHSEDYALFHAWLSNVKTAGLSLPAVKYQDIDAAERTRLRTEWNEPVVWPAFALGGAAVALAVPGILTFFRERQ